MHEARLVRDAEEAEPGIVRRSLDQRLEAREEPTKSELRKMVLEAAQRAGRRPRPSNRNPHYVPPTEAQAAWDKLSGNLRHMAEWLTDDRIDLALTGKRTKDYDQSSNVAAVHSGYGRLTKFVEALNAE